MYNQYFFLGLLVLLASGCAHYNATTLNSFSHDIIQEATSVNGLAVVSRAFSKSDCRRYLDRDVISKGYQPVQLYIENTSDKTYAFSLNRISIPTATPEEVSQKLHTSTIGRVSSYGAAALLASPLFAIPAVVDGFKSTSSNKNLDHDFAHKGAKDQLIYPHSHVNMVLFIPKKSYEEEFTITLVNEATKQPICIKTHTR